MVNKNTLCGFSDAEWTSTWRYNIITDTVLGHTMQDCSLNSHHALWPALGGATHFSQRKKETEKKEKQIKKEGKR